MSLPRAQTPLYSDFQQRLPMVDYRKNLKGGMTLLELTVVILVLLSLVAILFVGARAWRIGSDRALNILNLRNVQQAVRAHANTRTLAIGGSLDVTEIIGAGKYLGSVISPNNDIIYLGKFSASVPAIGSLYLSPGYLDAAAISNYAPAEALYADW